MAPIFSKSIIIFQLPKGFIIWSYQVLINFKESYILFK